MPEDVILARKQKVESIYYIVEGTGAKFNKRNRVLDKYESGDFCGEFALLKDVRPKFTLKAQTFMLMKVIAKNDVDSILSNYPLFYKEFFHVKDTAIKMNIEEGSNNDDPEAGTLRGSVDSPKDQIEYQSSDSDSESSAEFFSEEEEEVGEI
jgi:signal-transduction protein with cAMP-binding, CBS, and nucleotidyltransferase domain